MNSFTLKIKNIFSRPYVISYSSSAPFNSIGICENYNKKEGKSKQKFTGNMGLLGVGVLREGPGGLPIYYADKGGSENPMLVPVLSDGAAYDS